MSVILAIALAVAPLHASGDGPTTPDTRWQPAKAAEYPPNVQRARRWLRPRMPRRQFRCLYRLWANESGWRVHAGHPRRAYGIPQAFPGRKMRSAGSDWRHNALTQVRWGLSYVSHRYHTPCAALRFQDRSGWY